MLSEDNLAKVRALAAIAAQPRPGTFSAGAGLGPPGHPGDVGPHRREQRGQLESNVKALQRLDFTDDELAEIDRYAAEVGINLWARSSADKSIASEPKAQWAPHGGLPEAVVKAEDALAAAAALRGHQLAVTDTHPERVYQQETGNNHPHDRHPPMADTPGHNRRHVPGRQEAAFVSPVQVQRDGVRAQRLIHISGES